MGRNKIVIQPIANERNRQSTFMKRKNGLFKKAMELSILCQCDVTVIAFSCNNKLFQYSSSDVDKVLTRYAEFGDDHSSVTNDDYNILFDRDRKNTSSQAVQQQNNSRAKARAPKKDRHCSKAAVKRASAASRRRQNKRQKVVVERQKQEQQAVHEQEQEQVAAASEKAHDEAVQMGFPYQDPNMGVPSSMTSTTPLTPHFTSTAQMGYFGQPQMSSFNGQYGQSTALADRALYSMGMTPTSAETAAMVLTASSPLAATRQQLQTHQSRLPGPHPPPSPSEDGDDSDAKSGGSSTPTGTKATRKGRATRASSRSSSLADTTVGASSSKPVTSPSGGRSKRRSKGLSVNIPNPTNETAVSNTLRPVRLPSAAGSRPNGDAVAAAVAAATATSAEGIKGGGLRGRAAMFSMHGSTPRGGISSNGGVSMGQVGPKAGATHGFSLPSPSSQYFPDMDYNGLSPVATPTAAMFGFFQQTPTTNQITDSSGAQRSLLTPVSPRFVNTFTPLAPLSPRGRAFAPTFSSTGELRNPQSRGGAAPPFQQQQVHMQQFLLQQQHYQQQQQMQQQLQQQMQMQQQMQQQPSSSSQSSRDTPSPTTTTTTSTSISATTTGANGGSSPPPNDAKPATPRRRRAARG
eukprot:TRINITY_DN1913_c0_g1_i1.p1 TRINITY_DN1913_c0_g1~~TRINITY_DN1913_c0_g1_i1.p1  ORF type:complete len:633 (-),score=161.73 TRINITY_DN1913_c0_g1_i1:161-2059(-)